MNFKKDIGRPIARRLKKRYISKKSKALKLGQVAKDVMALKALVNAEKKTFTIPNALAAVGQLNGATGAGYLAQDITPIPAQGTTSITRNGASIKLHSSYMQFQIVGQTNTASPIKLKFVLVKTVGPSITSMTSYVDTMYIKNPFVLNAGLPAIVDYNSSTNPNFFGSQKIIRTKIVTLKPDQLSGQIMLTNVKIPMKYKNHHVRFSADGSTSTSAGQLVLHVFCDNGNASSVTASTLTGIANAGVSTGVLISYNIVHYFYDN